MAVSGVGIQGRGAQPTLPNGEIEQSDPVPRHQALAPQPRHSTLNQDRYAVRWSVALQHQCKPQQAPYRYRAPSAQSPQKRHARPPCSGW